MPDVDCKSSPRGVLGRPHTGLVCGLPASLRDSIFAASGTPGISFEALRAPNKTPAMPDVDCKSSPRGVLGRPHTGLVCGLPASLRDSIFAASGTPGILLEALSPTRAFSRLPRVGRLVDR